MKFVDVIGQEALSRSLVKTIKDGRISHAQLFLGPSGAGTLALALAYAQYVHCTNKQQDDSCGTCPSCNKNQKLVHPDQHFIYPVAITKSVSKSPVSDDFIGDWRKIVLENAYFSLEEWYSHIGLENKQGLIGKDESVEIIKKLNLKSFESEYKIMIIWMAERMNEVAANKLLKLIEEPPPKTLILLIAESADSILPTIISRTQLVKVPKIKEETLNKLLQERYNLDAQQSKSLAHMANGSFYEAVKLLESRENDEFNFNMFSSIMRLCYARKLEDIFGWVDEMSSLGRESLKSFFGYAQRMIRENYMLSLQTPEISYLNYTESQFAEKFHPFINQANAKAIAVEFEQAAADIERNAYNKIVLLDIALRITKLIR